MTGWQRRTRFVIGIFVLAFGTLVFFAIRERPEPPEPEVVERVDPNAVIESLGVVVTQADGGQHNFTVEAERQLTYGDGAIRLQMVTLTVLARPDREGFVATGNEAKLGDNQTKVSLAGDVRLTGSDGLTASADEATYDDLEGLVRVPGPMEFTWGQKAGSGVGATYDRKRDVLWLLDQAYVTVAGDPSSGSVNIQAQTAALAQSDNYMRFEGGVTMDGGGRLTTANTVIAQFRDETEQFELVELRGDARVVGDSGEPGSVREMSAHDMDLIYGAEGRSLQRVTLTDGAAIELAGTEGPLGRRIAGEAMRVDLTADGSSVMALTVRGGVEVDLPAAAGEPAQRIRAAALDGTGEPGRGLTAGQFAGNVEYRETRVASETAAALERVMRARTLDVAFTEGVGGVEDARFRDEVTYHEGQLRAEAGDARYDVARGALQLLGRAAAARAPRVVDERGSVEASQIELTGEGRQLVADGDVRSVLLGAEAAGEGPGEEADGSRPAMRLPAMLNGTQPVYVTAAHLAYDGESSLADYEGTARLWQGETEVLADRIILDERQGDLTATGSVRTKSLLVQTNEQTNTRERVTTTAQAEQLHYEDAQRRATYTRAARVNGPQGDLAADTIESYLGSHGDTLERVEAYDAVKFRSESRWAWGTRLTYFDADGRYEMAGTPVRLVEEFATECRDTTGQTLTFFRSTDTVTVDGNDQSRTQTTNGKCPELQFD